MGVVPALMWKHSVLCLFPTDFCLSRVLLVSLQVDGGQRDTVTETTACVCTQSVGACVCEACRVRQVPTPGTSTRRPSLCP